MVATEFVMQPQCEPNVVSVSEIVRSKGDKHPPPASRRSLAIDIPEGAGACAPWGGEEG